MSKQLFINIAAVIMILTASTFAQTSGFVYQGKLQHAAIAANGNYQFEFRLYDAASGGNAVGPTLTNIDAVVSGGVFAVNLDFGAASFDGSPRFLDISVRQANNGAYTPLNPRQPVASTPYAIRSLNSTTADTATTAVSATNAANSAQLGGIDANQYVTGQIVRSINNLSNNVTLNAGPNITISPFGSILTITGVNAIRNQTSLQSSADFNIGGTGTANILNAATQYNFNGNRILSVPQTANPGSFNLLVGRETGENTSGGHNTFIGNTAGRDVTTGYQNTFVGDRAGISNTTGNGNTFVGVDTGIFSETSSNNSFFGSNTGTSVSGNDITLIGAKTHASAPDITFATAIGSEAFVSTSNTVVLGRSADMVYVKGTLRLNTLGAAGSMSLCRNSATNLISTCTAGNQPEEIGRKAEAGMQEIRLLIKQQQDQIDALKAIVCASNPSAEVCGPAKP